MTKKDYELIASALREAYDEAISSLARAYIYNTADRLGVKLKADNPRFNHERFLQAVTGKGAVEVD